MIISARPKDLGGFSVRRILPYATHRMVGPFIFFDHMGPATFAPGQGMDVRPHPHIGLATVTYLFSGKIEHRDSLGTRGLIEPGAINWMTAGRGIVHSERTPPELRQTGATLHGIQLWVALPNEFEDVDPSFSHHAKDALPTIQIDGVEIKILLGRAFGLESPVPIHSDLFYAEAKLPAGRTLKIPAEGRELAAYVVAGEVRARSEMVSTNCMAVATKGEDLELTAQSDAHVMLIGGQPVGPRFIYWNFVASSQDRLTQARQDWFEGPGPHNARFAAVPGDAQEFIPLPTEPGLPKGDPL